jgi:hypothetical protein
MPDISEQPQINVVPLRTQVLTRLRPRTLMARMPAYRGYMLRRRRRALEREISTLDALIRDRKREQDELSAQVELANNHRLDDMQRTRELTQLIRDGAARSYNEQETQTTRGQRYTDLQRRYDEYVINRPYDREGNEQLAAQFIPLHRTLVNNARETVAPYIEERTLAERNYEQGFRSYYDLDQRLIGLSMLINDLEAARDDLVRQSDDLNRGHGRKKKHKKRTKAKRGGGWTLKYKRSINCVHPKGFSQKQYCKYGRKSKKLRN